MWAAEIWQRTRASPLGTTGKPKPVTNTPSSSSISLMRIALEVSPRITGPLRAILPFPADNAGRTCATTAVQDRFGNTVGNAIETGVPMLFLSSLCAPLSEQ